MAWVSTMEFIYLKRLTCCRTRVYLLFFFMVNTVAHKIRQDRVTFVLEDPLSEAKFRKRGLASGDV